MLKLLIIDPTPINNLTATGNLKKILIKCFKVYGLHNYKKIEDKKFYERVEFFLKKKLHKKNLFYFYDYEKSKRKLISVNQTILEKLINKYKLNLVFFRPNQHYFNVDLFYNFFKIHKITFFFLYWDNWISLVKNNKKFRKLFFQIIAKSKYIWAISEEMGSYIEKRFKKKNIQFIQFYRCENIK